MILREYGASDKVVTAVAGEIETVFDLIILDKTANLLSRSNRKSSIEKSVALLRKFPEMVTPYMFESTFILVAFGAPESGIKTIVNELKVDKIRELVRLDEKKVSTALNRSFKSTMQKIDASIGNYQASFQKENKILLAKNIILYFMLRTREVLEISAVHLIQEFVNEHYPEMDFSVEMIAEALNDLLADNYLIIHQDTVYFPSNIYYESVIDSFQPQEMAVPLAEYLEGDFSDRDLLLYRLDGMTLEEVGQIMSLTRERVRQRQMKVLSCIGNILEVAKYRTIFETYSFTKEDFTTIFHEQPRVFELLKLLLISGEEDFSNYIVESQDLAGKDKLGYLMKHKFYLNRFGELKKINKSEFTGEVLYHNKDKTFNPDEFFRIYSEESKKYPQLGLEVPNPRAIEGIVLRNEYVISTRGHKFRYYDYNFSDDEYVVLSELVDSFEDGSYSMLKIFNENYEIMKRLDIRDEYELHNLYKRKDDLLGQRITLTRSPEFLVGDIDKKEFIMSELTRFSDCSIEDCLDYFYEEFGHKKNTMAAYFAANFRSFVSNGSISTATVQIDEDVLEEIKQLFTKTIYLKHQVIRILKDKGYQLNTPLLGWLGYYMTGNIIFKKEFGNVTSAFSSIVMKESRWRRTEDDLGRSKEVSSYLFNMEKNRKLVMLDEGLYGTTFFLEQRGIAVTMLNDFVNAAYEFLPPVKYFSLFSLVELGFEHPLLDYGFEKIFYERLITTSDKFNLVNRKSPMLFAKGKSSPVTLELFYSDKLALFENGINIFDFTDDLIKEFQVDFEIDDVKTRLKRYGVYYSKDLEKLYFDKETYLNEVYA